MKTINKNIFYNIIILNTLLISFISCKKNDLFLREKDNANNITQTSLLATNKPNIILILGDDVGYEIPTYTGGQSYQTPNIDFMAANGMQFTNFFCHPDGPPSRLALVTGRYNFRNWVQFGYLAPKEKTFANLLKEANYSTCYIGKWQLDGGDKSIRNHGFDKYLVFMPFNPKYNNGHDQYYRRYKNPYLYENGQYLTENKVKDKYSEDLYFNYASNFINSNKTKPFFMVYSNNLVQNPMSPPPGHPDYAAWNPETDDETRNNKKYYPYMVAYMDKIIGKLISKVRNEGLLNRTIIIFTSDNATNRGISSLYKGSVVSGGKDYTTRKGLSVPLVVYGPATVLPGIADSSLMDMTDLFPTFANLARIQIPITYQPLDGITYYDNLIGNPVQHKQRKYIYCFYPGYLKHPNNISFVYDYKYKMYDSLNNYKFYNIKKDVNETNDLVKADLTPEEKLIKKEFKKILNSYFTLANH